MSDQNEITGTNEETTSREEGVNRFRNMVNNSDDKHSTEKLEQPMPSDGNYDAYKNRLDDANRQASQNQQSDTPPEVIPIPVSSIVINEMQKNLDDANNASDQKYDQQMSENPEDKPPFLINRNNGSDEEKVQQLKEELKTMKTELNNESLQRQQTLRDARAGNAPFTGGDPDREWQPPKSNVPVADPIPQPEVIDNNQPTDVLPIPNAPEVTQENYDDMMENVPKRSRNKVAKDIERDITGKNFTHLDDLMTPEQAARYENYFNQEGVKTTDDILEEVRENIENAKTTSTTSATQDIPTQTDSPLNDDSEKASEEKGPVENDYTELLKALEDMKISFEKLKDICSNNIQIQIIANNIILGSNELIQITGGTINVGGEVGGTIKEAKSDAPTDPTEIKTDGSDDYITIDDGKGRKEEDYITIEERKGEDSIDITSAEEDENKVEKIKKLQEEREKLEEQLKDPDLTEEERKAITDALEDLDNVIKETEDITIEEQKKAAEDFVELNDEQKAEFEDAGRKPESFMAVIERTFKAGGWKTLVSSLAMSGGSTLLLVKGGAIAAASGAGLLLPAALGAGIIGLSIYGAYKGIRHAKETAASQGMSFKEFSKTKGFWTAVATGTVISGVGRLGSAFIVPGIGPLVMGAVDMGILAYTESRRNKEEEAFIDKLCTSYEARRYRALRNQGLVTREGVNIEKIVNDMSDQNLTLNERKTAQKAAIASLIYLYEQTKEDKYKILHYTVKENGVDVRKEIDITKLGVVDSVGSTTSYPMLDLEGINFEGVVDTLDVNELKTLTLEASNHTALSDRRALTNKLVELFAGIEAADVERILSADKERYLQSLAWATGYRTASICSSAAIGIFAGSSMIMQSVQAYNAESGGGVTSNELQDQYRERLGEDDARVNAYRGEDGTEVRAIDLDNDGSYDLGHHTATGEYTAHSVTGAEKLFVIQNPEVGPVVATEFPTTTTGIAGTLSNNSGQVVGVMHTDGVGNFGVMTTSQLESNLGAVYTDSTAATLNITAIQPNGDMHINVSGAEHTTNLAHLNEIPGIEGKPGLDPFLGVVQPGDSVPSVLTKIMQQAKEHNPNLQQYDDYELQRSLYRGDRLANDSSIRSEFGFTNPVHPDQTYNVRNSPTILGWLQQLNSGQPVNLPGDPGHPGHPGIRFNFDSPELSGVDLIDKVPPIGPDTGTVPIYATDLLGASGIALGALYPVQLGGLVRNTTIELTDREGEDTDTTPPPPPVKPNTPEQEKEYTTQILRTQVFTITKNGLKVPSGKTFTIGDKKLTSTDNGWLLDGELITKGDKKGMEKLIATFTSLEKEEQSKVLVEILDSVATRRRVIISNEGQRFVKLKDGKWREFTAIENGQRNPEGETREVIDSKELADRILLIQRDKQGNITGSLQIPGKQETTTEETTTQTGQTTTTTAQGTTSTTTQATSTTEGTTVKSTTVETTSTDKKEVKRDKLEEFNQSISKIVKAIQKDNKNSVVESYEYKYDTHSKIWIYEPTITDIGEPQNKRYTTEELLSKYPAGLEKHSDHVAKDLTKMLEKLDQEKQSITVGNVKYTRVITPQGPVWRGVDKDQSVQSFIRTDNQVAQEIIVLGKTGLEDKKVEEIEATAKANTEQKDVTKVESDKPEKQRSRRLLRFALVATGVAGGIAAGFAGVPVAATVAATAFVVGIGAKISKWGFNKRAEKLRTEVEKISDRAAKREGGAYTAEELKRKEELERKKARARNIAEFSKSVCYLTTPLFLTSGAIALLNPEFFSGGVYFGQNQVGGWLEGAINTIKELHISGGRITF
jgi:hypothetical protein